MSGILFRDKTKNLSLYVRKNYWISKFTPGKFVIFDTKKRFLKILEITNINPRWRTTYANPQICKYPWSNDMLSLLLSLSSSSSSLLGYIHEFFITNPHSHILPSFLINSIFASFTRNRINRINFTPKLEWYKRYARSTRSQVQLLVVTWIV